ncbi:hypothetical protein [Rhodococcus wratislaviensis]|uniref:Uncharacterized protein n=1 Tax=Rhodococcus wratislaviensis NBRC 100605 TaxID=1219028 RepID=X0PMB5_RHOWR|nr:hypothetical protein [Rhodococcus wratislaviensis]GAF43694.1 hypothetical protein RW1_009_01180 [Rhodococcus wratislaviensis NBRC 100605]
MTVHTLVRSTGRRGWTVRCDVCEYTFAAAVASLPEAVAFVETNGWIVGERTWCPMCSATHTCSRTA